MPEVASKCLVGATGANGCKATSTLALFDIKTRRLIQDPCPCPHNLRCNCNKEGSSHGPGGCPNPAILWMEKTNNGVVRASAVGVCTVCNPGNCVPKVRCAFCQATEGALI